MELQPVILIAWEEGDLLALKTLQANLEVHEQSCSESFFEIPSSFWEVSPVTDKQREGVGHLQILFFDAFIGTGVEVSTFAKKIKSYRFLFHSIYVQECKEYRQKNPDAGRRYSFKKVGKGYAYEGFGFFSTLLKIRETFG